MTTSTVRRSPAASVAALLAVLLLFGALTFVAGLAIGGAGGPLAEGDPSTSPHATVAVPSEAATPGATPVLETISCAEPSEAFAVLCEAYARIKAGYVDEIDDELLVDGAVRGMVEYGLEDPYSGYLPPSQYGEALDDLSGEFSGIGAEVGMENVADPDDLESCTVVTQNCAMVVVAPLEGSPAEAAGLRPGDQILAIDGESTVGESVSSLVYVVRGEAGTDVTLTVRRGTEELDITITRAVIDLEEVRAELLDEGIGYVRLTSFTARATGMVGEALAGLLDQGATRFVLDLRGNPGGFIDAARGVASQFIAPGELLFTVESGDEVQEWRAENGVLQSSDFPLVVLVDAGSASASEIVAAALQEHGRATIVGQATFGKNTVQVWNDLPNGGGLRLTTDRWFTPEHNSVAPDGVQPDVAIASPEEPGDADPQLDRAVEILTEG